MSLRAFHLLFVAISVVLAVFVAAWSVEQYQLEHEVQYAVTCAVAIAFSGLLVVYGAMFQRKTRNL